MKEFENWWCDKSVGYDGFDLATQAWQGALKWYKEIVDKCEQDCNTDEDYKILYFHLKQVLINEIKE